MADDTHAATNIISAHIDSSFSPPFPPSSPEEPTLKQAPLQRRPLFRSMREALESTGQMKEEQGGYVVKRHSGHPQQTSFRSSEAVRSKSKHTKQRSGSKANNISRISEVTEADAAGYTVIRRRSSCDESNLSALNTASNFQASVIHKTRSSNPSRAGKTQPQRSRRGSMSAPQGNIRAAAVTPTPSFSLQTDSQTCPAASRLVIQPIPSLTPAASGWVAKACIPADCTCKIEEQPVEALWPKVNSNKAISKDSGWNLDAMSASGSQPQTWATESSNASESAAATQASLVDDDDLLALLGVTLK
ncbi:hypothetical protein CCR75_005840 [Bremia lactucae]|uniref:Uncharacterized protein n=1 Tax=Bremia lactucae TaxID=4779 RepID=A0A976FL07_BRELC|nr:hypothetical protein CCR75_005840 [Bremia lactucae]